jgi:hypothetical protein
MKNFELAVINQTGTSIPFTFENGRELVTWLAGTEHRDNVRGVKLECADDDGRSVSIFIPNDDSTRASLAILEPRG